MPADWLEYSWIIFIRDWIHKIRDGNVKQGWSQQLETILQPFHIFALFTVFPRLSCKQLGFFSAPKRTSKINSIFAFLHRQNKFNSVRSLTTLINFNVSFICSLESVYILPQNRETRRLCSIENNLNRSYIRRNWINLRRFQNSLLEGGQ